MERLLEGEFPVPSFPTADPTLDHGIQEAVSGDKLLTVIPVIVLLTTGF